MSNFENTKQGIPLLGDEFPTMNVVTTHGKMQLPNAFAGKWFVLFSHPADFTPVCTTEFIAFQKRYDKFKALNCELIGLSMDQVFSHIKWEEWIREKLGVDIQYPIIADNGSIANILGLVHSGKGTNTVRAVFVVDDKAKIRLIIYYPQEIGRNIDEVVRSVNALQLADKYKVAMPENWPNNELINDRVIIPPPTDTHSAKERLEKSKEGGYECYDWWFSHKKLEL